VAGTDGDVQGGAGALGDAGEEPRALDLGRADLELRLTRAAELAGAE